MTASSSGDINMGRFARLAQATYLLDRVLVHIQDSAMTAELRDEEAFHLDKALSALVAFTANETSQRQIRVCSQAALCQRLDGPW
jgi:hypothetical protein